MWLLSLALVNLAFVSLALIFLHPNTNPKGKERTIRSKKFVIAVGGRPEVLVIRTLTLS
jgi:hypothetical protein